MVRMSPPDFKRLEQTITLDLHIGGAELNVAVGASRLGLKSAWVSKLPENPLGRMIANKARELWVDISQVIWQNESRAVFSRIRRLSPIQFRSLRSCKLIFQHYQTRGIRLAKNP